MWKRRIPELTWGFLPPRPMENAGQRGATGQLRTDAPVGLRVYLAARSFFCLLRLQAPLVNSKFFGTQAVAEIARCFEGGGQHEPHDH